MNDLTAIGRWIILGGIGLLIVGGAVWLAGRLGLPLGRLPGDIRIEREGFSCFIPLASSLLLSILLTLLLNLFLRQMR
ncbi:MAG: DUF2905 domain-containing protein [Anaerolineales bacterium]|jgi:hypothetical protein